MKKIPLNKGKYALVDNEDFEKLYGRTWYLNDQGYAMTSVWKNNKASHLRMHRIIMEAQKGRFVDHIDGNRLDNRKSNLRLCTKSQNQSNVVKRAHNTSGYKGVTWDKVRNLWKAQIRAKNKHYNLIRTSNILEAVRAYNEAAKKLHGEFANLNTV